MTSESKQRLTIFLDPKLVKHAKAQAVVGETTLTNLVETALAEYLPEQIIINKPQKTKHD